MSKAIINRSQTDRILHLIDPDLKPSQVQKVTIGAREITVDLMPTVDDAGHVVRVRREHRVSWTRLTLRDLIRYARSVGAPLRRVRTDGATEYYQCWDAEAGSRRVLVRHWPDGAVWRVDITGRHNTIDGSHAVRVEMVSPTVPQIVAALELSGWDVRNA